MADTAKAAEAKKLLGESAEESRLKRLEKQKSRYRDRGGLFVPADSNPLLDVLLARGVNGESPSRRRAQKNKSPRSPSRTGDDAATSPSPTKKRVAASKKPRAKKAPAKASNSKGRSRSTKAKAQPDPTTQDPVESDEQPIAGPSKTKKPVTRKRGRPAKGVPESAPPDAVPDAMHIKGARASRKQVVESHTPCSADDDGTVNGKLSAHPDQQEPPPLPGTARAKGKQRARLDPTEVKSDLPGAAPRTKDSKKRSASRKAREAASEEQHTGPSELRNSGKGVAADAQDKAKGGKQPPESKRRAEGGKAVKRPKPALTSQEAEDEDAPVAPRRKRPKLYVPSDTESDDEPILAKFQARKAQEQMASKAPGSPEVHTTTKATQRRAAKAPRRAQEGDAAPLSIAQPETQQALSDPIGTSNPQGSSKPPAPNMDGDLETLPATKSRARKRCRSDHLEGEPGPPGQDAEAAKTRTERPTKRRKGKAVDSTNVPTEPDGEPLEPTRSKANKVVRANKANKSDKEPTQKSKQLKPASRRQKENKTQKVDVPVRKPKPRISMFPTPGMALDSDDEIDFLR